MVAVGPQARGLTLTKRKPTIIEVLRHMCHFFLIKRVSTVRLSQGIPRLVSRRDTAQPLREGGPTRVPIANSCHDIMYRFLGEPRELGYVLDAVFKMINYLKSEVLYPEQSLPMVLFCILYYIAAGTSGWRQVPEGFPLQLL
jgi:hypothetical protein